MRAAQRPERINFLPSNEPLPDEVVGETIDTERRSALAQDGHLANSTNAELKIIRERRLRDEGATLEVLGAKPRDFQGACAPDREPCHREAAAWAWFFGGRNNPGFAGGRS